MRFNDLKFELHKAGSGGVQAQGEFQNGWGYSVIMTPYSYGGDQGLYELAVTKGDALHYENPVAQGDVRGHLSPDEVEVLLNEIENFEKGDQI